MSDVTLSAAVRSTLLSLQNTTSLIDRTQNRLSTGLSVSSAVDDPVAFFQAKTLSDRARDFGEKKDGIDQGISSLSSALEGVSAIESLVRQLKGVANSLKSATGTQFTDLITQYNSLRTQIGTLADDTTFQGTNLINSTQQSLTVSFSEKTQSLLTVVAVNARESGLGVQQIQQGAGTTFNYSADAAFAFKDVQQAGATSFTYSADTNFAFSNNNTGTEIQILLTYQGSQQVFTSASPVTVTYGTLSIALQIGTTADTRTLTAGTVITVNLATAAVTDVLTGFVAFTNTFIGIVGFTSALVDIAAEDRTFLATGTPYSTAGGTILLTYQGSAQTVGSQGVVVSYGTVSVTVHVGTGDEASGLKLSAGQIITVQLNTINDTGFIGGIAATAGSTAIALLETNFVNEGDLSGQVNAVITQLDSALSTLRSNAQTLGSNVALLQTRLDFTELYVSELTSGSAKLTLADINEEGANLLALQTRQQLGISALAFAGQAEQGILALFR